MFLADLVSGLEILSQAFQQSGGGDGAVGIMLIVYLALGILMIASIWKVFTKAGQPGWAAIIPIYNTIVILQIAGRPVWWIVLLLVPLVNFIIMIMVLNDICKAFGKGVGFLLGLLFLPIIFWPMLGFGSSTYTAPVRAA